MSCTTFSRTLALLCLLLSELLLTACGHQSTAPSGLSATGDVVTIEVTAENRPRVQNLLLKMSAARDNNSPITVGDLVSIVPTPDSDAAIIPTAFPTALTVTCSAQGICATNGTGAAARIHTVATSLDLVGVDLGVRSTVKANFKVQTEGTQAVVCDVEGVYFSKLIVRKNLKAFTMDLTGAGEIKVWLAGAEQIPGC